MSISPVSFSNYSYEPKRQKTDYGKKDLDDGSYYCGPLPDDEATGFGFVKKNQTEIFFGEMRNGLRVQGVEPFTNGYIFLGKYDHHGKIKEGMVFSPSGVFVYGGSILVEEQEKRDALQAMILEMAMAQEKWDEFFPPSFIETSPVSNSIELLSEGSDELLSSQSPENPLIIQDDLNEAILEEEIFPENIRYGKIVLPNGTSYHGPILPNGDPTGFGYLKSDQIFFVGELAQGIPVQGREVFDDGSTFHGAYDAQGRPFDGMFHSPTGEFIKGGPVAYAESEEFDTDARRKKPRVQKPLSSPSREIFRMGAFGKAKWKEACPGTSFGFTNDLEDEYATMPIELLAILTPELVEKHFVLRIPHTIGNRPNSPIRMAQLFDTVFKTKVFFRRWMKHALEKLPKQTSYWFLIEKKLPQLGKMKKEFAELKSRSHSQNLNYVLPKINEVITAIFVHYYETQTLLIPYKSYSYCSEIVESVRSRKQRAVIGRVVSNQINITTPSHTPPSIQGTVRFLN